MVRKYLVYLSRKLGLYQWAVKQDTLRRERKLKKAFDKYGLEALQIGRASCRERVLPPV